MPTSVYCCYVASVMSDSVWPHRRQHTRLLCPWDSPGRNTGVGCHFLLQCMKVKSESEIAQSCPTLCNTMDCSPPGSSVHGIFQARVLECGAIAFSLASLKKKKIRRGTQNLTNCQKFNIKCLPQLSSYSFIHIYWLPVMYWAFCSDNRILF